MSPGWNTGTTRQRLIDGLLLVPVLLLAAWCCWAIATQDKLYWVDLIFDDAYYYLGIARNMAEHGRSSFLPPFETNGYQPLWLLLLSASARLFGTGERSLCIQLLLLTLGFVLLFALLSRRWHGRMWPALLVTAAFPLVMTAGLETVMLPALVLAFFRSERWWVRGMLASLIFLARLDALALMVMHDALLWRGRRRQGGQGGQQVGLRHWWVLAPVMALYFGLNLWWFGTPVPVSGQAKAVGNVIGENVVPLLMYACAAGLAVGVALVLPMLRRASRGGLRLRYATEIGALLLTLAACAGYYSLLSGWAVWGWYYWPAMLLTYYLLLETVQAWVRARSDGLALRWQLALGATLAVLLLPQLRLGAGTASRYLRVVEEAAGRHVELWSFGRKNMLWVDRFRAGAVPRGALLAMGDRAGSLGFFLGNGYRFIHTEGLVGPLAYVRALRDDKAAAFLQGLGIAYLVVDRQRYLESADLLGVAEPVQGWSAHVGPSLHCFDKAGIVLRDDYAGQTRLLVDWRQHVACPADFEQAFKALRSSYGGLREFSLPGEYGVGGPFHRPGWLR